MSILDLSSGLEGEGHINTLSNAFSADVDEVRGTDWKTYELAFSFSPCLPLRSASVFMPFLLKYRIIES